MLLATKYVDGLPLHRFEEVLRPHGIECELKDASDERHKALGQVVNHLARHWNRMKRNVPSRPVRLIN